VAVPPTFSRSSPDATSTARSSSPPTAASPTGGEIFDDTTVAAAILDRLLHHGTVLTINGPSYRMRRHHERVETLRAGLQAAPAATQ
jgi:IstB-like ATP binding protein